MNSVPVLPGLSHRAAMNSVPVLPGLTASQRAHYVAEIMRRLYPHLGPVGLKAALRVPAATRKGKRWL